MKYDRDKHHRRSTRLNQYDYSKSGYYFVTICTRHKELYFEQYHALRKIVEQEWGNIPKHYSHIAIGEFVIMPNHLHGIIIVIRDEKSIIKNAGATLAVAQNETMVAQNNSVITKKENKEAIENRAGASPAPTIGDIIGSFKSLCVNRWLKYIYRNNINAIGKFWQRNYHDHIIRSEKELYHIREYITTNPLKWEFDRENELSENYNMKHDLYFRGVYEQ